MTQDMMIVLACLVVAVGVSGVSMAQEGKWIHPKAQKLASPHIGPYVNLGDGNVLAVSGTEALVSKDEGKTWEARPLFKDATRFLARPERALLRTRDGAIVMGFLNEKEIKRGEWKLNDREALSKFYLPTYITRSLDEGKTWTKPVVIGRDAIPPGEKESAHRLS